MTWVYLVSVHHVTLESNTMDGEHDGPTSFVNCINLTIKEFHDLALFRGVTGGGCCLLCVLTLVLIIIHRAFKTILQRLFLYLTISTIAYCGVLTLHVEHYFHPYEGQKVFCIAIGFLDQYTGSVQLLFTFGITAFLFYKVCELCSSCVPIARLGGGGEEWRECRMVAEISWVLFSFVIPLAFNWLPFIFTPYGETGPWCWIDSVRDDCSASESGYWEQMLLWYIPLATVAFCSLLLLLIMMGVFIWICKDAQRARQRIESGVIKQSLLLLAFLVFFCALCTIEVSIRTITHRSNDYSNYGVWIIYALSTPVSAAIIPVAFFFYLYSSKMLWVIKRAAVKLGLRQSTIQELGSHGEHGEQRTIGRSEAHNYPSETVVHFEHSGDGDDSGSLERQRLLQESSSQQHLPHYGSAVN